MSYPPPTKEIFEEMLKRDPIMGITEKLELKKIPVSFDEENKIGIIETNEAFKMVMPMSDIMTFYVNIAVYLHNNPGIVRTN